MIISRMESNITWNSERGICGCKWEVMTIDTADLMIATNAVMEDSGLRNEGGSD